MFPKSSDNNKQRLQIIVNNAQLRIVFEAFDVVSQAHQGPFPADFLVASQLKTSKAHRAFDDPKDRLHALGS